MNDIRPALPAGELTIDRIRAEALLLLPDCGHHDRIGIDASVDPDYDRDALAAWFVDVVTRQASAAYAAGLAAAEGADEAEFARVAEMATAAGNAAASGAFADYLGQLSAVLRQGHTLAAQHDLARTIDNQAAKLHAQIADTLNAYPALRQAAQTPALVLPSHLE